MFEWLKKLLGTKKEEAAAPAPAPESQAQEPAAPAEPPMTGGEETTVETPSEDMQ